jgi:serine/threonine-protein kinase
MFTRVVSIADSAVGQPTTIGRYVVLAVVGRGAMGQVYAAYDPKLNRKVAIKVLRAQPGGDVVDPNLRLRMVREAQAIAKLSHPNVVIVHDVGAFESEVFVAMEFVDGQTLSEWLASEPRAWPDVLKIFTDAGRGLVAAHEKDLVHRDFKPDNVMIGADGHVRVMDFGLARSTAATVPWRAAPPPGAAAAARPGSSAVTLDGRGDGDLAATREVSPVHGSSEAPANVASDVTALQITHAGAVLGTPAYMAPEQFLGDETDARTDQFSFCVALYEALYRVSPFAGKNFDERKQGVLGGEVREPPPRNGVPPQIRKVLLRGLSRDPALRWPSMKTLLAALEDNRRFSGRRRLASGAAAKLKGVWEAPVRRRPVESQAKAEMRRAFLATGKPYAAAAFEGAGRILDEYAAKWSAMYVDICEATHVRGEQSPEVMDLRMTCLLDCLEDLRALTLLFRNADAGVVQNAVKAANALGGIERCADVALLRVAVRPPEDSTTRAAVDRLRAKLAEVRALDNVGRYGDALEALAPLEEEIHGVGYRPLSAETLLMRGRLQTDRRELQLAAQALEEAVWLAEVCRHDEVVAEAAGTLVYVVCEMGPDLALAEVWGRHAEAVLGRMGGHDVMWGLLLNNRAIMRWRQGRLPEGLEDARRSLAAKERAGGTDNPDNALSLNNIALMLVERGELHEALQLIERGVSVCERGYGPEHPASGLLLSNHAEILNRLDRFEEARASAARALAIFEVETGSDNVALSYPLAGLGVALLGLGCAGDALPFLERAAAFRDTTVPEPAHWGEVHFALARALRAVGRDLPRARALAEEAREEYRRAPPGPVVARGLACIDAWLADTTASRF